MSASIDPADPARWGDVPATDGRDDGLATDRRGAGPGTDRRDDGLATGRRDGGQATGRRDDGRAGDGREAVVRYWCPVVWNGMVGAGDGEPAGVLRDVVVEVVGGTIAGVRAGVGRAPVDAVRLGGVTVPGLANVHSHAFHRALRGRTQRGRGSFWTWRDRMYAAAERLDPESYLALARAVYAEMALAGITTVGEFHYLHHGPGGKPYDDPNEMGAALVRAAAGAGIRIAVLDTCYLAGGIGTDGRPVPLAGPQLRFTDGDAERWAARVDAFRPQGTHAVVGRAVHSVRAVPADQLRVVARQAVPRGQADLLHVHLSEQRAENEACRAAYGRTPTELLAEHGLLGPGTTLVHATHTTDNDLDLVQQLRAGVCLCPTTERDLADGIGPSTRLDGRNRGRAGADQPALTLGSDSHAVIDLFEEARAVELNERLRTETRGHLTPEQLLHAATVAGQAALASPAGMIAPGRAADLVTVGTSNARLAGADPTDPVAALVFGATAADVRHVIVAGRQVVKDGQHLLVDDVAGELDRAIRQVLP
jgi:formiminoglutamate deiminase